MWGSIRRPHQRGRSAVPVGCAVPPAPTFSRQNRAVNQKRLPSPTRLSTPMSPPIICTRRLLMANSRPIIHEAIVRADCLNGWFRSSAARQMAGCRKPHSAASDRLPPSYQHRLSAGDGSTRSLFSASSSAAGPYNCHAPLPPPCQCSRPASDADGWSCRYRPHRPPSRWPGRSRRSCRQPTGRRWRHR